MYEKAFPVYHMLDIELPWLRILNTGVFSLHEAVFEVGARAKANYQAQGEHQPGRRCR